MIIKNTRKKTVFIDSLRQFRLSAGLFVLNTTLIYVIFRLYDIAMEPFWYAFAITLFCTALFFVIYLLKEQKKAAQRHQKHMSILTQWNNLPEAECLLEYDYTQMIERLGEENQRISSSFEAERKSMQNFYTAWVHQIKMPIAVMKLALGSSGNPDRRALQEELFRIEQYTDMVLAYQRLSSSSNDLVIQEYALDELIREVIRKFASQFIYKKIKLNYEGTDWRIVTDKKWFICILEQLISNALKYTPSGTITVSVRDGVLSVSDTGIGIAPEDLPRIFEKGYTGANGRLNDKSSGLGLYLCGEAASLLNIPITAESQPGQGSSFSLEISEKLLK